MSRNCRGGVRVGGRGGKISAQYEKELLALHTFCFEASWSWEHVRETVRDVTLAGHQLRPLQKERGGGCGGTAQGCPEHPTPFFRALQAWRESPLLTTHNDHINWIYRAATYSSQRCDQAVFQRSLCEPVVWNSMHFPIETKL